MFYDMMGLAYFLVISIYPGTPIHLVAVIVAPNGYMLQIGGILLSKWLSAIGNLSILD
jgi:hypothetical protein